MCVNGNTGKYKWCNYISKIKLASSQNRQMQQGGQAEEEESDLARVPKVQYSQSIEEQALQKEQVNCKLKVVSCYIS